MMLPKRVQIKSEVLLANTFKSNVLESKNPKKKREIITMVTTITQIEIFASLFFVFNFIGVSKL
jgi:hypothetical protein